MRWYNGHFLKQASSPPAYLRERISDLNHAADVSKTSPSNAKSILNRISSQLMKHNDIEYAKLVEEASKVVLDSPLKARGIISRAIRDMEADKDEHDMQENKNGRKQTSP